jgi:hypothetical protein
MAPQRLSSCPARRLKATRRYPRNLSTKKRMSRLLNYKVIEERLMTEIHTGKYGWSQEMPMGKWSMRYCKNGNKKGATV